MMAMSTGVVGFAGIAMKAPSATSTESGRDRVKRSVKLAGHIDIMVERST
jgi:hypothetical protein